MMTQQEVQDMLKVSRQTLHKWRTKFGMPHTMFGSCLVFNKQEVNEWYMKYKNKK